MAFMTSRQRMLAALDRQEPDRTPCSFMIFGGLKTRSRDYLHFIQQQLDLGLDVFVQLPPRPPRVVSDAYNLHGLPVQYDPRVRISEWVEHDPDESTPILIKEYHTPAGKLRTEVRQTADWRWGEHIPFLDDYIVPRARKFPVSGPADLEPLRYLLVAPTPEEQAAFHREAEPVLALARARGLLVAGGWGVGADLVGWICGLDQMIFFPYDQPQFLHTLLELIATWNRARMEVVLTAGIDLYIKRAWYENLDFFTPATWKQFIFRILKAEVDQAHDHGARFGYLITASCMPLLEQFAEAGVDVLIGVDPHRWDIAAAKTRVGDRVCLWGGVNGHLTVETGTPVQVRDEVRRAMQVLAPGGSFILSPVDNVREDTPHAWSNVQILIDEWRRSSEP